MFEALQPAAPDSILGLNEAFNNDPNPAKINLGVGVYKNADGNTPILDCVKAAERRLLAEERQKSYLAIDGISEYRALVRELLFADEVAHDRAATIQTPGGTGALRVAADFLKSKLNASRVWLSKPTWANHPKVFEAAGLETKPYRYLQDGKLDFGGMLEDLQQIPPGDVVCLHACCHNPSGVDPTQEQWKQIAHTLADRRLLPLVDCAYQGFGEGIEPDVSGLRTLLRASGELLVCSSFSKNFGLYAERVGALTLVAADAEAKAAALSQAKVCVRTNYSNPPKHGAAIVASVLADEALRAQWESEVADMRERINRMRELFVEKMQATGADRDFSLIRRQRGMFSFSGLTPVQVDELRSKHSIYIVGSGRINVAGISEANVDRLCAAIKSVL